MSISRVVGQTLNLEAQLWDLEASLPKVIKAELLNADASLRTTVTLTHTSKGIFVDNTEVMPNIADLLVKFYTYQADGVTLDSENYGVEEERYELNTTILESTIIVGDSVEGEIQEESELTGVILSEVSEGILVEDETLEGIIDETQLEGVANEC